MSALTPKADLGYRSHDDRFVPKADIDLWHHAVGSLALG